MFRILFWHVTRRADSRADWTAGKRSAIRVLMMLITTSNSTRVNARQLVWGQIVVNEKRQTNLVLTGRSWCRLVCGIFNRVKVENRQALFIHKLPLMDCKFRCWDKQSQARPLYSFAYQFTRFPVVSVSWLNRFIENYCGSRPKILVDPLFFGTIRDAPTSEVL